MFKKITFGLGGVVPLLQYIQGRKYEQLAELCGEVDESGVVPLRLLRNKDMMGAIGAVVGVIKVYCLRANQEDADAMEVSNKLDAAGREQVLFQALEAPDDDLKVLVMECLLEVPIDNLQAQEVANIVSIIADCDNLTVGRTEEILGTPSPSCRSSPRTRARRARTSAASTPRPSRWRSTCSCATRRATRATTTRRASRRPRSRSARSPSSARRPSSGSRRRSSCRRATRSTRCSRS